MDEIKTWGKIKVIKLLLIGKIGNLGYLVVDNYKYEIKAYTTNQIQTILNRYAERIINAKLRGNDIVGINNDLSNLPNYSSTCELINKTSLTVIGIEKIEKNKNKETIYTVVDTANKIIHLHADAIKALSLKGYRIINAFISHSGEIEVTGVIFGVSEEDIVDSIEDENKTAINNNDILKNSNIDTELNQKLRDINIWNTSYERLLKKDLTEDEINELWVITKSQRDAIIDSIIAGEYEWSTPQKVLISKHGKNKKRVVYVYALKDRLILGVMYRALSDYYSDKISDRCFSYKKSVSTSHAIQYIKDNKDNMHSYGVKIDIHAYFNSVSREKVIDMINELFTGGLKVTIEKLMLNDDITYKNKKLTEWKSLIPGNPLSSFFANWCLRQCDNYFDNLDVIYARYSDDIIILDKSKEALLNDLDTVCKYLNQYNLEINADKYTWFEPGDEVQFLGLKIDGNGDIDIADHSFMKLKKQIHRWCKKGRVEIERDHRRFDVVARGIMYRINSKNLFCALHNDTTFGWALYAFPRITTDKTLKELDLYTKNTFRALKTGKHNKANYGALTEEEFKELGWVSLVQLYHLYKTDRDYFMEVVELLHSKSLRRW